MSESVVDTGLRLLASKEREQHAAEARKGEVMVATDLVIQLLDGIAVRLAMIERRLQCLEECAVKTNESITATRVRRPVRDDLGTIQYVVDSYEPGASADVMVPNPLDSYGG